MTRFAGQAFNNIRKIAPQEFLDVAEVTPDDLHKFIAQEQMIGKVFADAEHRELQRRDKLEKEQHKFGFNPKTIGGSGSVASQLNAYENWVKRESVPLGDEIFLNIAPERLNQKVFELKGELEAQVHANAQKELARMIKTEIFNRRALDNEAQSFENIMERGLINLPVAENRVLGKRRERARLRNIAIIREELQELDREMEMRMQKAADKYFGKTPPPSETRWEGTEDIPF